MNKLLLSLSLNGQGHHPGAWRLASANRARATDPAFQRDITRAADAAGIDLLLTEYPPRPTALPAPDRQEAVHLDSLSVAASLIGVTERIGLAGTVSATYSEPFNVARQFTAFDHISRGRAALLLVPGLDEADRPNFDRLVGTDAAQHDKRSAEFVVLMKALFDSWEDEALALDKAESIFAHPSKVHVVDHKGAFFSVNTSMNAPRPPQGHPVVIIAPKSTADIALAKAQADVAIVSGTQVEMTQQASELRNGGSGPKVFADLYVTLGARDAEAAARIAELDKVGAPIAGAEHFVGTPEGLAALLADWPVGDVNLLPTVLPEGVEFIARAVALLRGADASPARQTLRQRLGLARPAGRRS